MKSVVLPVTISAVTSGIEDVGCPGRATPPADTAEHFDAAGRLMSDEEVVGHAGA